MQAEIIEKKEYTLRIVPRDSMGRTPELAAQMEQNDPRPPRLGAKTKAIHAACAEELATYPKVLYKRAINRQGVPCGDPINPNYPMPYDLAVSNGFDAVGFKHIGRNRDDGGHIEIRWPWRSILVGVKGDGTRFEDADPDSRTIAVDVEASRKEEAKFRAEGAVDHPSKLKLPDTALIRKLLGKQEPIDELGEDEELPEATKPNGKARIGKTA